MFPFENQLPEFQEAQLKNANSGFERGVSVIY